MKFSIVSMVTLVAFVSQALGATVLHCAGPDDLKCPDGLTCCGPLVDGVGVCVPGPATVCKTPLPVKPVEVKNNCGGANQAKCDDVSSGKDGKEASPGTKA